MHRRLVVANILTLFLAMVIAGGTSPAAEPAVSELARTLGQIEVSVFPESRREELRRMVRTDLTARLQAVNDDSSARWAEIDNRQEWEAFRKPRLDALCKSLGNFPPVPEDLHLRVTGEIVGDGFRIQNLIFESRPDVFVTANLYVPAGDHADETDNSGKTSRRPGILICHSHHTPKENGELQDMGMTWARAGCVVLVMDQIGYGERRQHPFVSDADYDGEFRRSRQYYYFRYDTGIQLHLAGDSLIGWMAWDLMRGVDLLLDRPDVDPQRIILLGGVAGGGDPAAVTGALDERIAAVVPFNFGGPQPETRFPLPDDVEKTFNYAGSGGWESTRNLRNSAAGGFLPWVIVGGVAPRRLVFAHEFSWDRERDPVWKRLEAIYASYDHSDRLAFTHGRGELKLRPPQATHCTHIGREHRVKIHEAFRRWFGIDVKPEDEYSNRRPSSELRCFTPEAIEALQPKRLHEVLSDRADEFAAAFRRDTEKLSAGQQRELLQKKWAAVLGKVQPQKAKVLDVSNGPTPAVPGAEVESVALEVEPGILVPLLLIRLRSSAATPSPVVVAVSQSGKAAFLKERPEEIAALIEAGITVCVPDVRDTGETRGGSDRGRQSVATGRSSTELMLGGTCVGARLRDLRSVLGYLRTRRDINAKQIGLWGDSFAAANPPGTNFKVPRRVSGQPRQSEPLGGLLALLGALYEPDIQAVYTSGSLSGFRSVLNSQHVVIPHDVVIPGALTNGDLADVTAALAPRAVCLEQVVDGLNRRMDAAEVREVYQPAIQTYRTTEGQLSLQSDNTSASLWFKTALSRP